MMIVKTTAVTIKAKRENLIRDNDDNDNSEQSEDEIDVEQNHCPVCLTNARNSIVNHCGNSACYD